MKSIAIILSVLFLFLCVKPCSDGANAEDQQQEEISVHHNHQEDSDDACPITCVCNCCGIAITYQPLKMFSIEKIHATISTQTISSYQSHYHFNFLSSIWQPPQLFS